MIAPFVAAPPTASPLVASVLAAAQAPPQEAPCGPPGDTSAICRSVLSLTDNEVVARAADAVLSRLGALVVILVVAFVVNRLLRRMIRHFVRNLQRDQVQRRLEGIRRRTPRALLETTVVTSVRRAQRAETIGAVLRSASTFVVWSLATLQILSQFDIEVGPLVAGAGIAGIALGFGAQNLVRDFLSGIFMLVEDQYGVGDVIDVGPASGVVEGIGLRTTRVRDVEGTLWHVPNGQISRVGNKSQQWSRALLDIEVAPSTPVPTAIEIIERVADEMWKSPEFAKAILDQPEVWGVEAFTAAGVVIRLVIKTAPLEQWNVAREFRRRLKAAFDTAGIEMPFGQRAVLVHPEVEGRAAATVRDLAR